MNKDRVDDFRAVRPALQEPEIILAGPAFDDIDPMLAQPAAQDLGAQATRLPVVPLSRASRVRESRSIPPLTKKLNRK